MESCSHTTGHFRFSIRFVLFFVFLFVRYLPLHDRMISTNKKGLKSLINTSQQRAETNWNKSDLIC